jgi:Tol biopolymer transport system component
MKHQWNLFIWASFISILLTGCARRDDFPALKGLYLGQKPPGMTPEIFAPGIVSTQAGEFGSTFSPDGNELYFAISGTPHTIIACMKFENDKWTRPQTAPFSGKYSDWDLNFSPNGNMLYFTSNRPFSGTGPPVDNSNLWIVERKGEGWSKPKSLGDVVNTGGSENYPSVTNDGTLYFFHNKKDENSNSDIYFSRLVEGKYTEPVKLGDAINSSYEEWDPFIAPDESYLIFCSVDRPDGFGDSDLYISFRKEEGTWTKAVNMGEKINTSTREICPSITSDGKYLFFTSARKLTDVSYSKRQKKYKEIINELNRPENGDSNIFWMDAKVIEELRPGIG